MNFRAREIAVKRACLMSRKALRDVDEAAQSQYVRPSIGRLKVIENLGVKCVEAACADSQVVSVRSHTYAPTRTSQFV
jgi:hypothetical protein